MMKNDLGEIKTGMGDFAVAIINRENIALELDGPGFDSLAHIIHCVTLDMGLNFSEPQFLHPENGNNNTYLGR